MTQIDVFAPWFFAFYKELMEFSKTYQLGSYHWVANDAREYVDKNYDLSSPRDYYIFTKINLNRLSENSKFFWLRRTVELVIQKYDPNAGFWTRLCGCDKEVKINRVITVGNVEIKGNNVEIRVYGKRFIPELTELLKNLPSMDGKDVKIILKRNYKLHF